MSKSVDDLNVLLNELLLLPSETEHVEFKHNAIKNEELGEYISALSNAAAYIGKPFAYIVWGIEDKTHTIIGTDFKPFVHKHKQQELQSWLLQKLEPRIEFCFYELKAHNNLSVVLLEISAASYMPVRFDNQAYIRIGSYKKPLGKFPAKERALWSRFEYKSFEEEVALHSLPEGDVLTYLNYPEYFRLMDIPLPEDRISILSSLAGEGIVNKGSNGLWDITNLGAILFARSLSNFKHLGRKAVRLILYKGDDKRQTIREISVEQGYAVEFDNLVNSIKTILPSNEEIVKALRKEVSMYPELAIRELIANALIHQDFSISGTGPMIEVFNDRMEITNPGNPLIDVDRFLDSPPRSRNEKLASLMRRMNICEERGSGIDKVVLETEIYQLPAPVFETYPDHTRSILFAHRQFKEMDMQEKVRAAYLHSVLRYLNRKPMNNSTLRERFGIDTKNSAMVSRIIKEAVKSNRIKPYDEGVGTKSMRYVPWWA